MCWLMSRICVEQIFICLEEVGNGSCGDGVGAGRVAPRRWNEVSCVLYWLRCVSVGR